MDNLLKPLKILGAVFVLAILTACGADNIDAKFERCEAAPHTVSIAAGTSVIGSDAAYPEERPSRTVAMSAFNIDASEVTNAQFRKFVVATGYVTTAEKPQAGFDKPGGAVFKTPSAASPGWWEFTQGAYWRHPEGPGSQAVDNEPVVQVSYTDAKAYADWAGRRLPTEAEWEHAAKAGAQTLYVWGDELVPKGQHKANTWQGVFPIKNDETDGHFLRAPAGCYEPNDYGLYDMIGNVWEWTSTEYQKTSGEKIYTIKGGSFLCAPNYCQRYRASARQPQEAGFSTNHIGFRTVASE